MMTFATQTPKLVIVELDDYGFVVSMHEKADNSPCNLATQPFISLKQMLSLMRLTLT